MNETKRVNLALQSAWRAASTFAHDFCEVATMRIGIDLGGTKIEGIVLDDGGKERARVRMDTPQGSYEATVEGVAAVVRELESQGRRALPRRRRPSRRDLARHRPDQERQLHAAQRPSARSDLKRILERDEVRLSNDANCFAVSEAADGAAAAGRSCSASSWAPAWAAAS